MQTSKCYIKLGSVDIEALVGMICGLLWIVMTSVKFVFKTIILVLRSCKLCEVLQSYDHLCSGCIFHIFGAKSTKSVWTHCKNCVVCLAGERWILTCHAYIWWWRCFVVSSKRTKPKWATRMFRAPWGTGAYFPPLPVGLSFRRTKCVAQSTGTFFAHLWILFQRFWQNPLRQSNLGLLLFYALVQSPELPWPLPHPPLVNVDRSANSLKHTCSFWEMPTIFSYELLFSQENPNWWQAVSTSLGTSTKALWTGWRSGCLYTKEYWIGCCRMLCMQCVSTVFK